MKKILVLCTAFAMFASTALAQSVSIDGDGWVQVDGKTIGRVWYSYTYQIVCSNGYVNKPSDSMLRQLSNRDEAIGLLLQACRK